MSHRSLPFVAGLTLGDYLLWNWSVGGGHDVLAFISGLTLLPLLLASVWLLAVVLARALAGRPRAAATSKRQARPPARATEPRFTSLRTEGAHTAGEVEATRAGSAKETSRKIAA